MSHRPLISGSCRTSCRSAVCKELGGQWQGLFLTPKGSDPFESRGQPCLGPGTESMLWGGAHLCAGRQAGAPPCSWLSRLSLLVAVSVLSPASITAGGSLALGPSAPRPRKPSLAPKQWKEFGVRRGRKALSGRAHGRQQRRQPCRALSRAVAPGAAVRSQRRPAALVSSGAAALHSIPESSRAPEGRGEDCVAEPAPVQLFSAGGNRVAPGRGQPYSEAGSGRRRGHLA